jgi:hypothetical protein
VVMKAGQHHVGTMAASSLFCPLIWWSVFSNFPGFGPKKARKSSSSVMGPVGVGLPSSSVVRSGIVAL